MSQRWAPKVTVASVVERDGYFLLVQEHTTEGLRLNQPAGHLDPGESPIDGCVRETLEETARAMTPTGLLGLYLSRYRAASAPDDVQADANGVVDVTYFRVAIAGEVGEPIAGRALDRGIVKAEFLSLNEIRARQAEHRSPLVMQCIDDYLAVKRGERPMLPLTAIYTHPSVLEA